MERHFAFTPQIWQASHAIRSSEKVPVHFQLHRALSKMKDGDGRRDDNAHFVSQPPPLPPAAPPSPRPIRLQDIPMRIVTRRRRSTATTVLLSRPPLPPLAACKPPLPAALTRHGPRPPFASLPPAVDVEALQQKADLAELEAKNHKTITVKALGYVQHRMASSGLVLAFLKTISWGTGSSSTPPLPNLGYRTSLSLFLPL